MDPPIFNGTGDLAFLDHVQVWATLKGYEGERKAVARLRDGAFGNFRRLLVEEQSKFDSIAASLKEEFLYGSANRLQAVAMLRSLRWNRSMEPIAAFGHEVLRLVALAYSDFIARDVFLDGLHPSFQVPLRSKQETASATVTALVQEVN